MTMQAMVFNEAKKPLLYKTVPRPAPSATELLIKITACGVCRTDVHIFEGDLKEPKPALIPGHQIVGRVVGWGEKVKGYNKGDRVGVPWLGKSCGQCEFCTHEAENLCDFPRFTGYTVDGGYAEYTVAEADFCFPLPDHYDDLHAAPLLCAGLVGFRSLRKIWTAEHIGFYGFGAAASLQIQVATALQKKIYAFTREGDIEGQQLALSLGATWSGSSLEMPPRLLDGAIIFAPVGELVPLALKAIRKGGTVVLGGIHMSPIPSLSYDLLWGERTITSVANLTRQDGHDFLKIVSDHPIKPLITVYPLHEASQALLDLASGKVKGSLVLQVAS